MNRNVRFALYVAVLASFSSAVLLGEQSWIDKFIPKKEPQVVSGAAQKPLVEPPANVLALQDAFAKVADAVKPAVVNISAVSIARVQDEQMPEFYYGDPDDLFRQFFGGQGQSPQRPRSREFRREGTGSGVIIDPDGYILTNNHVVQDADQLTVTLSNEKQYKGKVVGTDARTDLAVIRIKGPSAFPFVPLADSSKTRIGDWVLAFGSPFGLEQTVTSGIISAIRQSLSIEGKTFRNLLQTDAAINRGNSGGALVNIRGELVGINTAIYAPTGVFSGIGFAIPVNDAKVVLKQLIEKGFVERSWMGVEIAPLDDVIAGQFGLGSTDGALVNHVVDGSPAAKAGIERGDVIIEFAGKKVMTVQGLQDAVSATPPGKSVPVKIMRDGQTKFLNLKTETMPKNAGTPQEESEDQPAKPSGGTVSWLGASFNDLTPATKQRYGLKGDGTPIHGVVITDVPANSLAADAGLREGDVLRSVNRTELQSTNHLKNLKSKLDAKKGLVFDVVRQGRSFYLSYKSLQ